MSIDGHTTTTTQPLELYYFSSIIFSFGHNRRSVLASQVVVGLGENISSFL